jgi:hypothetical protein
MWLYLRGVFQHNILEVVVPGITSGRQLPAIGVIQLPI